MSPLILGILQNTPKPSRMIYSAMHHDPGCVIYWTLIHKTNYRDIKEVFDKINNISEKKQN